MTIVRYSANSVRLPLAQVIDKHNIEFENKKRQFWKAAATEGISRSVRHTRRFDVPFHFELIFIAQVYFLLDVFFIDYERKA